MVQVPGVALVPIGLGGTGMVLSQWPWHSLRFGVGMPTGSAWLFNQATAQDRIDNPPPSGNAFVVSLLALLSGVRSTANGASSGGGGPGGVLTSATPPSVLTTYRGGRPQGLGRPGGAPPSVEGLGRLINSAHGGGRSGAKPRKRCPPGHRWNARTRRCERILNGRGTGYARVARRKG